MVAPTSIGISPTPKARTARSKPSARACAILHEQGRAGAQQTGRPRMASNGIRDRVAIVGMGCTPFGEHWDKGVSDLLIDASKEALGSAGIELPHVDAFWVGTLYSGQSGLMLSRPLKIDYKPVSRLENYCATGSEAFRNARYAVPSGAYDVAMAIGVEKLKDSGFSGLPGFSAPGDGTRAGLTAPAKIGRASCRERV